MIKKLFRDILTVKDNTTFDQIKVMGLIGFIIYNILAAMDVIQTKAFEYQDYATGLGIMFAAIGGALWAKKDTEPGN